MRHEERSKPRVKRLPITVVIADDHPVVVEGLASILAAHSDFALRASCLDGCSAVRAIDEHEPDVALLDVQMPEMDGMRVLSIVSARSPRTNVVMLTGSGLETDMLRAFAQGAKGVLAKCEATTSLMNCLRTVAEGGRWFPQSLSNKKPQSSEPPLTPRERELTFMISTGLSNKEIARHVGLTEGTVKAHLYNIYKKLGLSSRSGLAAIALGLKN
jgi:two-component system, NarL family, nitrate/nitrite response regulator NarL